MPPQSLRKGAALSEAGKIVENVSIISLFVLSVGTESPGLIDPRLGTVRCREC